MSEKQSDPNAPSAPTNEEPSPIETPHAAVSTSTLLPPPHSGILLGSPVNDRSISPPVRYSEPPPSYQAAMAYPAVSLPFLGGSMPEPSFPKPAFGPPSYNIGNQQRLAPSLPPLPGPPPPPPPPVVVNVANPANVRTTSVGNCPHCRVGIVMGQTDLCCLICLIILAICTFPVGLLFLCFVPCAVHKRCNQCHRIG